MISCPDLDELKRYNAAPFGSIGDVWYYYKKALVAEFFGPEPKGAPNWRSYLAEPGK